jgi:hypothetical protein
MSISILTAINFTVRLQAGNATLKFRQTHAKIETPPVAAGGVSGESNQDIRFLMPLL